MVTRLFGRPLIACALLLVVYVGLAFINDPHGYLGTDTGGKVATLRAMERHHGLNPDLGYWAARWDPEGRLHPLYYTTRVGSKWVNVTTLPALYLAYPLFRLGGYRLALLIPMLGSVLAALAARALALRLGATRTTAEAAFWLTGLASPLTIYALDFWEHSLGVALMAWAFVCLLDVVAKPRPTRVVPLALAAGLLFGASSTMRTESLVYGAVGTGIICIVLLWRGWQHADDPRGRGVGIVLLPAAVGFIVLVGLAIPVGLNSALERSTLGGTLRAARTTGTVAGVGSVAGSRLKEAGLTAVGLEPDLATKSFAIGAGMAVLVLVAVGLSRSPTRRGMAVIAGAGATFLYLVRFADGLGFVPGLLAAAPIAIVGLIGLRQRGEARVLAGIALISLPVVWSFQFLGGAAPQWGGRYILVTGFLLAVVGVIELADRPVGVRVLGTGLAVAVTVFGVSWLAERTHGVADAELALGRRPEPVLVSTVAHLAREGGGYFGVQGDKRWLTAANLDDLQLAAEVVRAAGDRQLGLITLEERQPELEVPGFAPMAHSDLQLLPGVLLRITTYQAQ